MYASICRKLWDFGAGDRMDAAMGVEDQRGLAHVLRRQTLKYKTWVKAC